jgi:hypothetical protein
VYKAQRGVVCISPKPNTLKIGGVLTMGSTFKGKESDVALMAPPARIAALRPWILILLIIGVLAMLFVGYRILIKPKPSPTPRSSNSLSFFVPTVYAQSGTPNDRSPSMSSDLRQDVMVGLFVVLSLVLLMSVGGVMFARDASRVSVAGDVLKTVLGFFIGAATGFLR